MDGYVALRFIKLCKRLCAFAAFFGELKKNSAGVMM